MRVLVTTWGNPFQWEPITYEYRGIKVKSRNTLPILVKTLEPERILILVADTMANYYDSGKNKPEIEEKSFSSYSEVVEDTKERILWHIKEEVIEELREEDPELAKKIENMLKDERITIEVLPGVGVFGNITVEGEMLDFYYYATYKLAEWLPVQNNLEVYLDLTHGINFMPTFTYRALRNLLGLLAYLYNVKFEIVNSEPYPLGVSQEIRENTILHIREIGEGVVRPRPQYSPVEGKLYWNAFISSVANGFPLVFASFYPNIRDVEDYLNKKLEEFLVGIEVGEREDGKPYVKREKALDRSFKNASKLYYALRVFNTKFQNYPKKEVPIEEIMEISKIFESLPRIGIILERQVEWLRNLVYGRLWYENGEQKIKKGLLEIIKDKKDKRKEAEALKKGKTISLAEAAKLTRIFSPSGERIETIESPNVVRNFIAHSGFEYNIVYVKYDRLSDRLYFFYKDKEKAANLAYEALLYRGEKE
ncbi:MULTISPECIES: CRISPR-associated CARF protein Csx1 [Pyrococcus]|uniref:CRISPR-associated CARF protein Csx1 n=1 Tax=Pyrococcus TaxID=2260 RepID=UPI00258C11B0|nr:CRISPR-associated CARF protein Csx1 [Pyrococcus sp.]MDK2869860.1 CRISPR-associated protein Csx1 [Pyrococcus sp.]